MPRKPVTESRRLQQRTGMMLYRVRLCMDLKIYDRVRLWGQRFRVTDVAVARTVPRKAILFKALQFDD